MSSSKAFGQYLELDSKSTTMLPSDALSQSPKSDTAIDTTPSSNVSIIKQLQSDLAEIDGQLKGFATHEEPPNEALIQAKTALTEAKAALTQAKAHKGEELITVLIRQLQSDVVEVNKQLHAFSVRGERPNNAVIQAKVNKEKHLYKLKQKKELQEGREVSMEHTINATKALVGYLPTPDELVSRATIKRRNGRAYAKNEVFVYQTYRYDAYLEPPHKEAKYRHVKDEHFTVPYPIDLPHYFPQEGHELTEVDRQKFDSEHKAEGSWLGFEDFDPHGYLEQAGGLDTLSLVAAKG